MGIGTFGRSETFEPHAGDGHVTVTAHRVDGGLDLGQLGGVAAIFGIDDGLVDWEVNEGRTGEFAVFLAVALRAHVDPFRSEVAEIAVRAFEWSFGQQFAAAAEVGAVKVDRRAVHPVGIGDYL